MITFNTAPLIAQAAWSFVLALLTGFVGSLLQQRFVAATAWHILGKILVGTAYLLAASGFVYVFLITLLRLYPSVVVLK